MTAALPGVKPENVEINVTGDTLTINGRTEEEERREEEGYLYREIRRGTFTRSVTLPSDVNTENATARFENGLLTLTIPKAEQAKPRQIKVSATSDASSARRVEPGQSGEAGSQSR
ncbi:MAG: Hsp20/alpha crystallin family protein [Chloroflexota bacterium]|nr:Hsp20/alpha crystallin family protein [Chloroflexota bacterium]